MKRIIEQALEATVVLWEPIRRAYRRVCEAVHVLANAKQRDRAEVQMAFVQVPRLIGVTKHHCGRLDDALSPFLR